MSIHRFAIAVAFMLLACGCGQNVDLFGSVTGVPVSGVATWYKIDMDPDAELVQPYVLFGDDLHRLVEPSYLLVGDLHYLFYEVIEYKFVDGEKQIVGSTIHAAVSDDGFTWEMLNDDLPVLEPAQAWEGDAVGAPSVVYRGGRFLMWYAGGYGAGIGYAGSEDGLTWAKYDDNPILQPDQDWEEGLVAAPAVLAQDGHYLLFYSGGDTGGPELAQHAGRAIGYAHSADGLIWIKQDDQGRNSADDSPAVHPLLTASQLWEGYDPDNEVYGWVASPFIRVDRPVDRDVYRLYYTGNRPGDPVFSDVSIGYAGSFDGMDWQKADEAINPVVGEKFPLTLPGLTDYMIYSEYAPSVVRLDAQNYRMIFAQSDPLDTLHGLAVAVQPKPE